VLAATRSAVLVPVAAVGGDAENRLRRELSAAAGSPRSHELVDVVVPDIVGLFAAHGLAVGSMDRPAANDPVFFASAAAAGIVAATAVQ
jgi:hypothetical protein